MPTKTTTRKRRTKTKTALQQENRELKNKLRDAETKAAAKPDPLAIGPAVSVDATISEPEKPEVSGKTEVSTDAENPVEPEKKIDPAAKLPQGVPKILMQRLEAALKVVGDVQAEVEAFKKHPHYAPGDMPANLRGIQGPGNRLGTRELNYIDKAWLDPTIHIHWAERTMVDYHRGNGYEPFDYDKFMTMIEARGGSCRFNKDTFGHVAIGDLVLMKTSRDWYEEGQKQLAERNASREGRAKNLLYSKGAELGVEVDEGDRKGPKLRQIFRLLEEEFGSDKVRSMFLNQ